ncbi:MAG: pyrroline-5-carboxylate reductase [Bacteroidetes bacterium]|nr:pyrroline-5-carboxylate reductase [Bacteroidota bacterium]
MNTKKIAILGGGNLGASIAEGLLESGYTKAPNIHVTRRNSAALGTLKSKGIIISSNNEAAVKAADIIILAVKPYQADDLLASIKKSLNPKKHILCSVVSGYSIEQITKQIPANLSVLRAMPNTAIAIRQSITCLSIGKATNQEQEEISGLFEQLGRVVFINENLMDAATVLGACGIAYALRYIRANIQGGIEIGFDAATASLIAAQTVKGAAELLIQTGHHPEQEIDKVTTPKGCTIAGLNEMEHQGFSSSLIKGLTVSYKKIAKE